MNVLLKGGSKGRTLGRDETAGRVAHLDDDHAGLWASAGSAATSTVSPDNAARNADFIFARSL